METKKNLFVLNSCPLGAAEVTFWNGLFARYDEHYCFKFFSTSEHPDLNPDEFILLNFGWTVFDNIHEQADSRVLDLIRSIAAKDHIWDIYDEQHSARLAGSWIAYWSLVVAQFQPQMCIIWNGHHVPEAALRAVCEGAGITSYIGERGPLRDTFVIDRMGINFSSEFVHKFGVLDVPSNPEAVAQFASLYFSRGESNWSQPDRLVDKQAFRDLLGISKDQVIVFFPEQLDCDANSKLFSPHFRGSREAIAAIANWCDTSPASIRLVVKQHPMQESARSACPTDFSSVLFVTDIHVFDCIEYSDAIVSINSSAAVEAALAGKPVLLLGDSIMSPSEGVIHLGQGNSLEACMAELVERCKSTTIIDSPYFSKLLFDYLQSEMPAFRELGIAGASLPILGDPKEDRGLSSFFSNRINNLGSLTPRESTPVSADQRYRLQLESAYFEAVKEIAELQRCRQEGLPLRERGWFKQLLSRARDFLKGA